MAAIDLRHFSSFAFVVGMLLGASAASAMTQGAELHACALPHVKVKSRLKEDAMAACEGADRAIQLLENLGLAIPPDITIEIVDDMPDAVNPSALGAYIKEERRILVLKYAVLEKRREWYCLPVDREVYRGIVSHEVTHAVSAHNFRIEEPSILAEEYIAYVTLLSTMARAQRRQILNLYPDDATGNDAGLHDVLVYMIDPVRFGVTAYRHFIHQKNGREFVEAILDGKAMADVGDGF
ncbi:hypothetical protein GCM10027343_00030 [Noviherbaspirillum agri]